MNSLSHARRFVSSVSTRRSLTFRSVSASSSSTQDRNEMFAIRKAKTSSIDTKKSNTLVIVYGFYKAPESAIRKYCDLYNSYGFDVVFVKSVLKHFSWPKNSVILAESLLQFLEKHCTEYKHFLVHAFSMGAYNFTVCFGELYDKPDLYPETQKKISGIVYDSVTIGSLANMSTGVASGVSSNVFVRKIIIGLTHMYFSATFKNTVAFYDHYVKLFKENPLKVPTLIFYCKNDPMSDVGVIETLLVDWRRKFSFLVMEKCWDKSKHAAHLLVHREEYLKTLDSFLKQIPNIEKELKVSTDSKL